MNFFLTIFTFICLFVDSIDGVMDQPNNNNNNNFTNTNENNKKNNHSFKYNPYSFSSLSINNNNNNMNETKLNNNQFFSEGLYYLNAAKMVSHGTIRLPKEHFIGMLNDQEKKELHSPLNALNKIHPRYHVPMLFSLKYINNSSSLFTLTCETPGPFYLFCISSSSYLLNETNHNHYPDQNYLILTKDKTKCNQFKAKEFLSGRYHLRVMNEKIKNPFYQNHDDKSSSKYEDYTEKDKELIHPFLNLPSEKNSKENYNKKLISLTPYENLYLTTFQLISFDEYKSSQPEMFYSSNTLNEIDPLFIDFRQQVIQDFPDYIDQLNDPKIHQQLAQDFHHLQDQEMHQSLSQMIQTKYPHLKKKKPQPPMAYLPLTSSLLKKKNPILFKHNFKKFSSIGLSSTGLNNNTLLKLN